MWSSQYWSGFYWANSFWAALDSAATDTFNPSELVLIARRGMVNHVRTLLLNQSGNIKPSTTTGWEEYVPSSYKAVELPSYLRRIRQILFGLTPDRYYLNYRLAQYMTLLHASDLASYVTDLGTRITYTTDGSQIADDINDSPAVTALNDAVEDNQLFLFTDDVLVPIANKLRNAWLITVTDSTTVTVTDNTGLMYSDNITYSTINERSDVHAIPRYTGVSFAFEPVVGGSWLVELLLKPETELTDILVRLNGAGPYMDELFTGSAPFTTFGALWYDRYTDDMHKLGAVLLAVAYKTDELVNP